MVTPAAQAFVLVPFPFSDLSQAKLRPAAFLRDETLQHAFVRSLEIRGGLRLAFCPVISYYSL